MSTKILIAGAPDSDNALILNALNDVYRVLVARDNQEALSLISSHSDLAILMIDLTHDQTCFDAFSLLERYRQMSRSLPSRIIILTRADEAEKEIRGLRLGACDYLRKPLLDESLKARIELHLELLSIDEEKMKLNERSLIYETIFQQAPVGIAISHEQGPSAPIPDGLASINPMCERIIGRSKDELSKLGWANITHPDDLKEDLDQFKRLQAGEIERYEMEKRYVKPDGTDAWVHIVVAPFTLPDQKKYNHICLIQDISPRKEAQLALAESERSKTVLLSHLPGLAYRCKYDSDWTMLFVSNGCCDLTGYAADSLLFNKELSFNDLIVPSHRDRLRAEWQRVLSDGLPFRQEYEIITRTGDRKWVLELGQGLYDQQGEVEALEGIILDISDRKLIEDHLKYNSEHDLLTGLYNYSYLDYLLRCDAKRDDCRKRALIAINLSAVHLLSMAHGYHYSQELIRKAAEALRAHCSENRQLFITNENRFAFYVKAYADKNELADFCAALGDTLKHILAVERIDAGIGVVEIDNESILDVERLFKSLLISSEKAIEMYDGDFCYCFFDSEMEKAIVREEAIRYELSQIAAAEEDKRLYLQYQPILCLETNQIYGFEALARLSCDNLGQISPIEFIPIAERTKLIIPIGDSIIRQAFTFLNQLNENGYDNMNLSINISAIQLLRSDFNQKLFDVIDQMQVNPEQITLEITESIFASNYQEINRILKVLQDKGINIAIDDFGTGYSSLARERELNINSLKIDKYFIDNLIAGKPELSIAGDIISMAHKMGHFVVAEGVEHEAQRQYLEACGCDKIQGYLISKPLDREAALMMLQQYVLKQVTDK